MIKQLAQRGRGVSILDVLKPQLKLWISPIYSNSPEKTPLADPTLRRDAFSRDATNSIPQKWNYSVILSVHPYPAPRQTCTSQSWPKSVLLCHPPPSHYREPLIDCREQEEEHSTVKKQWYPKSSQCKVTEHVAKQNSIQRLQMLLLTALQSGLPAVILR